MGAALMHGAVRGRPRVDGHAADRILHEWRTGIAGDQGGFLGRGKTGADGRTRTDKDCSGGFESAASTISPHPRGEGTPIGEAPQLSKPPSRTPARSAIAIIGWLCSVAGAKRQRTRCTGRSLSSMWVPCSSNRDPSPGKGRTLSDKSATLILFGATGDLAHRMLFPSLYRAPALAFQHRRLGPDRNGRRRLSRDDRRGAQDLCDGRHVQRGQSRRIPQDDLLLPGRGRQCRAVRCARGADQGPRQRPHRRLPLHAPRAFRAHGAGASRKPASSRRTRASRWKSRSARTSLRPRK